MTINSPARRASVVLALGSLALALAACGGGGGSSSSSSAAPASSSEMPGGGGTAECNQDALTKAATDAASAGGFGILGTGDAVPAGTTFDSYQASNCSDGWALVAGNVTPPGSSATAGIFLFQAEGQFWVPKTVSDACSGDVPSALKSAACQFVR